MTLHQQFQTILSMLVSGFIIGFLFDGYRVLKGKMNFYSWLVFLIDVFFGIFSALLIFTLLLWLNCGQLRLMMILAFLLGLWIYYQTISQGVIRLWLVIYSLIYSLWKLIVKTVQILVVKPMIFLYKSVFVFAGFFISSLFAIYRLFTIFFKKVLLSPVAMVYKTTKNQGVKFKTNIKKKAGFHSLLKKLFNKHRR
ncbi:spore cortex biosynthesis protein YabQ [Tepidibacillus sp. LV47]|uniref:spore cortex biosynthesis protein YabQ n=1 Tax=Tepidibacillus sp. LV47 TaxID=3398228 RepID=UPI003AAD863E